jgi:hypothetical protein
MRNPRNFSISLSSNFAQNFCEHAMYGMFHATSGRNGFAPHAAAAEEEDPPTTAAAAMLANEGTLAAKAPSPPVAAPAPAPAAARRPNAAVARLGGGNSATNKCGVCKRSVYPNDPQFVWDNVKYHKVRCRPLPPHHRAPRAPPRALRRPTLTRLTRPCRPSSLPPPP